MQCVLFERTTCWIIDFGCVPACWSTFESTFNNMLNSFQDLSTSSSTPIITSTATPTPLSTNTSTKPPSGTLPVMHTGDTWTERVTANGSVFTSVTSITGQQVYNGIDSYVFQSTMTPPLFGVSKITGWVDKTTLQGVGTKGNGSYNGQTFTLTTNDSYKYSAKPYPLSVGKTWTTTDNTTTTAFMMGQNNISIEINNYTYKVERMENVTVPAGTFNCFKIVKYNGTTNDVVETQWVTDVIGGYEVKDIDNQAGMTCELTSYSLSK
jgi:hypothetical protein